MTKKEIVIARIVEEKDEERNEEKDLIELRTVEEMVPRWFHKYLKMFEKKKSERMPTRKIWDHTIDLRRFYTKKGEDISIVKSGERESIGVCEESVEKEIY